MPKKADTAKKRRQWAYVPSEALARAQQANAVVKRNKGKK